MKTLSTLIKEIFSVRRADVSPKLSEPETNVDNSNQQFQTSKQFNDETENLEVAGDDRHDNSDCQEPIARDQAPLGEPEGETPESGGGETGGESGEPEGEGDGGRDLKTYSEEDIREAFRQGEIAGRNQAIEQRFFHQTPDGIPQFRGRPAPSYPSSDIFSMAREA